MTISPGAFCVDTPLRVHQIVPDTVWGGVQVLVAVFARLAARHGISVGVIALNHGRDAAMADRLRAEGVDLRVLPARKILDPVRFRGLARLLAQDPPDLLHCHLTGANTLGSLAGRLVGVPVLGGLHLPPPEGRRAGLRGRIEARALRWGAQGATACGPATAASNRPRLGGLPIETVLNPVPDLPPPGAPVPLSGIRPETGGTVFVAVGRLVAEKRVDLVLRALGGLCRSGLDCGLVVLGDGPERARLTALAGALGLSGRVRFLGLRPDVAAILAQADVYVSASRVEGLSLALLEAMAAGLPVVATAVGDTVAAVDAASGILVPPDDPDALAAAMAALARDPPRRRACGAVARARARAAHAPDLWAARLAALYRRTAQGAAP